MVLCNLFTMWNNLTTFLNINDKINVYVKLAAEINQTETCKEMKSVEFLCEHTYRCVATIEYILACSTLFSYR